MNRSYNKRLLYLVGIILGVILLYWGVQFVIGNKNTSDTSTWYADFAQASYSEEGMFYFEDGFIHYCDVKSGLDVLICDKSECKHERDSCSAAFDALAIKGIRNIDNNLFFITDYTADKFGTYFYYQTDLNGENRKKLATIHGIQNISGVEYYKQYIILSYFNTFDENYKDSPVRETGIVVFDCNSKSVRKVVEKQASNASIDALGIANDSLYFTYGYNDLTPEQMGIHFDEPEYLQKYFHSDLYVVSLEGGSESKVIEGAEGIGTLQSYKNKLFYSKGGSTYEYDLASKKERLFLKDSLRQTPTYFNGGVLFNAYDSSTKSTTYYEYLGDETILREIGSATGYLPIVILNDITYAWGYGEDGNGRRGYFKTSEFLKGNYNDFHEFTSIDE